MHRGPYPKDRGRVENPGPYLRPLALELAHENHEQDHLDNRAWVAYDHHTSSLEDRAVGEIPD
jgi:hypothetical protein